MAKKKDCIALDNKFKDALIKKEEQLYDIPENWVWVRLNKLCQHNGRRKLK